jgi:uncharacterized Rmd1/YagE family protein
MTSAHQLAVPIGCGLIPYLHPKLRMPVLFADLDTVAAHAYFVGQKIDLGPFHQQSLIALDPLMVQTQDGGYAVLFDYGVVVLLGLSTSASDQFLTDILDLIVSPFDEPETEDVVIRLAPVNEGKVEDNVVLLSHFEMVSLQLVADVLAKSVVLAEYESQSARVFDQIEPFALSLTRQKFGRQAGADLLEQIGNSLLIQHKMVGRVEIIDKPELLWEYPELDRLYARLEDEYEIRERHHALERKLDLVSRTAETALEIQHQNTGIRLEWYVVILIVVEVLLSLYELVMVDA